MLIVIDNYDSFTYNLVQYLGELGHAIEVYRNDRITPEEIAMRNPSHIVISPGPGTPEQAGISMAVIQELHQAIPILGVCLGHQAIAAAFGGRVDRAERMMHGKVSNIYHQGGELFEGIPSPFEAGRYHSLLAKSPLPPELQVTAFTSEGEIMALRHRGSSLFGVQFHPESILTRYGKQILENFASVRAQARPLRSDVPARIPQRAEAHL